jgi:(E)-4-hydroxy-3-methylbut-2-enyl-diphosphate synthase
MGKLNSLLIRFVLGDERLGKMSVKTPTESCFPVTKTISRRKTRQINVGGVLIGGDAPVVVQSMTKTDTRDVRATLKQIERLTESGCEIVRAAVPDEEAVHALGEIIKEVEIPVIADIHFDHSLAVKALEKGVDGLRINPGTIGSLEKVKEVVKAAKERQVPIRIGVNSGSLEKEVLNQYQGVVPEAMVESAMRHVRLLEDLDFTQMKISLKAADVFLTLRAYQLLADRVDYPFHTGITESGSLLSGTVRSSVGLGLLLSQGLADTIRVSLTAPPEEEVRVAYLILSSLGIRQRGPEIISCPICGRCEVDLMNIAVEIEKGLETVSSPLKVAVMGCMVNGPGEAKDADIGIACGRGMGVLFQEGKILKKVKEKEITKILLKEARRMDERKDK